MNRELKIAAVVTEYRKYSHAQHIVDRFLYGYGWDGKHHRPNMKVVSMYTDQVPESDLSRDRESEFDYLKIYPTVAEALTCGGEKLAVDGVMLIGEHGDYPTNEKGQRLYPRYELFQQIVSVFRESGRSVPVFNDKHLSWKWKWAQEMVDISRELDFGFLAGSSLPVARRIPELEFDRDEKVTEAMSLAFASPDSYDFHGLEVLQGMVERRDGGETGVVSMHALRGDAVWEAMQAGSWDDGGWDPELFQACLCRSHQMEPMRAGLGHSFPTFDELKSAWKPIVYRFQYADGLKATMFVGDGLVTDFTFAARIDSQPKPVSTLMFLPYYDLQNFFSPQVHHIERLFETGVANYPVERTLLTSGLTEAGVDSLYRGQRRIMTPHLRVSYQPSDESTYWRT